MLALAQLLPSRGRGVVFKFIHLDVQEKMALICFDD